MRLIDMDENQLREIVREESDAYRKVLEVIDQMPPMRTRDAAEALKVSTSTICRMKKSGQIETTKYGKIPMSEIIRIKMKNAA
jgi:Mn-dependent DtxR family transcriptional regulator